MKKTLSLILFTLIVGTSCIFGQEGIDQYQLANGWYRFGDGLDMSPENFVANYKSNWGLNSEEVLSLQSTSDDELGYTHYSFSQFYQGYEVEHTSLSLHYNSDGLLEVAKGKLVSGLDLPVSLNVSEATALQSALTYLNASEYAWQNAELENELKEESENSNATYYPTGKLLICHDYGTPLMKEHFHFAYQFKIAASIPQNQYTIYVSATNGNVLGSSSDVWYCNSTNGSCTTTTYGTQSIEVKQNIFGIFRLEECSRKIHTKFVGGPSGIEVTDNDGNWGTGDQNATKAHWCAEKMWDYYKNVHNKTGANNVSGKVGLYVNDPASPKQAKWSANVTPFTTRDVIAIGIESNGQSMGVLDILGHEFTHGVANSIDHPLVQLGESGALAESFSDIFGTMIERYAQGTFDWTMGEDKGLVDRDFQFPSNHNQPEIYLNDTHWSQSGDIHINSGVQNKWFYLLCTGSQDFSGIGEDKAAKIAFRNMMFHLETQDGYAEARIGSILSAIELFGVCSKEVVAVMKAWDAVGVTGTELPPNTACIYLNGYSSFCSQNLPTSILAISTPNISNYDVFWSGIPANWTTTTIGTHRNTLIIMAAPPSSATITATVYQNGGSSGKKLAWSSHSIDIKNKCFRTMNDETQTVNILPNPANDLLSIHLTNGDTKGLAEIFNVQGQLVQKYDLSQSETQISIANITNGIYFVRVSTNETTYQSKLQIIH